MAVYSYWSGYLEKARNGHDRPLGRSRSKRVSWCGDDIALRLHSTDCVVLHPDGSETISTGGWRTVTTMQFLREHSKARIWSDKGQWFVRVADPARTPPRVQKCRTCHGEGTLPVVCYGARWCYVKRCYAGEACFPGGEHAPCAHGRMLYHRLPCEHGEGYAHALPCKHGRTEGHRLPCTEHGRSDPHNAGTTYCYRCDGIGRCDYGSKEIHYAWSGYPLRIDADGYPLLGEAKPAGTTYSDSGDLLSLVLPGLNSPASCPACDNGGSNVSSVIIHLNDAERWTREQIAAWVDGLDVDLTFPVPDKIPAEIH